MTQLCFSGYSCTFYLHLESTCSLGRWKLCATVCWVVSLHLTTKQGTMSLILAIHIHQRRLVYVQVNKLKHDMSSTCFSFLLVFLQGNSCCLTWRSQPLRRALQTGYSAEPWHWKSRAAAAGMTKASAARPVAVMRQNLLDCHQKTSGISWYII